MDEYIEAAIREVYLRTRPVFGSPDDNDAHHAAALNSAKLYILEQKYLDCKHSREGWDEFTFVIIPTILEFEI